MNNTLKQKVKKLNTRSTYGKGTDTVRVRSHAIVTPIQPTFARVPYRSPAPGVCVCVNCTYTAVRYFPCPRAFVFRPFLSPINNFVRILLYSGGFLYIVVALR